MRPRRPQRAGDLKDLVFCEFLGNRETCRVMGQLRDRVSVVIRCIDKESAPDHFFASLADHRGIARAVFTGNADLEVKRLEKHLEYGKQSLVASRRP